METRGTGDAGSIDITTQNLNISNQTEISASTFSRGQAGDINITANNFNLKEGATVITNTAGSGQAGDILLQVKDNLNLVNSTIAASTDQNSNGQGGSISIGVFKLEGDNLVLNETGLTNEVTLSEGGTIIANSEGTGNAGQISINAKDLTLDNQGEIVAITSSPQTEIPPDNMNITLRIDDELTLRNNSLISAEALNKADGGNIDIDAEFIIAYPSSGNGNDIIAKAPQGKGGNINIAAESIFNLQEREAIPGNGTNDIDVTGAVNGLVTITTPNVDITRASVEDPQNVVESEQTVTQACQRTGTADKPSGLTIKGKGGVPPQPTEPFMADALIPDGKPITIDKETDLNSLLVEEIEQEPENPNYIPADPHYIPADIKPIKTSRGDIYPARGMIKTEDGKIILTRYPTDNINTRTPHKSANCSLLSG